MSNKITLSGVVTDSQTKKPLPNIPVALAQGTDSATAQDICTVDSDKNGAWSFTVDPGDYIVRMPQMAVFPNPKTPIDMDVYCGQAFPGLKTDKTGIDLGCEKVKSVMRTPEHDARYAASVFDAVHKNFVEQTKNATTQEEVQAAIAEAQATLKEFLEPFMGLRANVPCPTCQTKCYGSSDPNCMYNCLYVPVHCY
ncbi:hypothetical protein IAD21_02465 [Abditibacteriota bacterium]|nr:hypothetical protein IAD21_02465 [Abditibacteriota bacterium]